MSYEWMESAACKGLTKVMFPGYHNDHGYVEEARKVCHGCKVKKQCLEYALEFPPQDMHGVWAGLSPAQLAREQRRRGIKWSRPTIAQMHENYRKHRN